MIKKKLVWVLFVFIVLVYPILAVDEKFIVEFDLRSSVISQELVIDIKNLQDSSDHLDMSYILKETNFNVDLVDNVRMSEWKKEEYDITVCDTCTYGVLNCTVDNETNVTTCVNESVTGANCAECGSHVETRERWVWRERQLISKGSENNELKHKWEQVAIKKYGTKRFKLSFDAPLVRNKGGWGNSGTVYLNLNGRTYVDKVNSSWWDASYIYRTCSAYKNITDYQVKLNIHSGSGTNNDTDVFFNGNAGVNYSSLRLVRNNATEVSFWIESNLSTTNLWTNITQTGTYCIYYGNAAVADVRSGNTTFQFFDHFLYSGLNANVWNDVGTVGIASVADSFANAASGTGHTVIATDNSFDLNYTAIRWRSEVDTAGSYDSERVTIAAINDGYDEDVVVGWVQKHTDKQYPFMLGSAGFAATGDDPTARPDGVLFTFECRIHDGFVDYIETGGTFTISDNGGTYNWDGRYLHWVVYKSIGSMDWILLRKYVTPEPTWNMSWSAEECGCIITADTTWDGKTVNCSTTDPALSVSNATLTINNSLVFCDSVDVTNATVALMDSLVAVKGM